MASLFEEVLTQNAQRALRDAANRPSGGEKRQSQHLPGASALEQVLYECGCCNWSRTEDEYLEVRDVRRFRRQVETSLSSDGQRLAAFSTALEEALQDPVTLRRCLLPLTCRSPGAATSGDSLLRLLLNLPCMQRELCTVLLQKLCEYTNEEAEGGQSLPSLILGQLRWLEAVVDSSGLTDTVLEVMSLCPDSIQKQLIGFLPEIAGEEDQEKVVDALEAALCRDLSFIAAVQDALGSMQLAGHLQRHVLQGLTAQLPAVDVEDLPGLVRFLVQNATPADAPGVVAALRTHLHCACIADPRLAAPDLRGKLTPPKGSSPEALLLRELTACLPAADPVADAWLHLLPGLSLSGPGATHRPLDFWALLVLHAKRPGCQKAVEGLLRKKILDAPTAAAAWIGKAIQDHQDALSELWQTLLNVAERLARFKEAPLTSAAAGLYVLLFVAFGGGSVNVGGGGCRRQEVLQALHTHLGSGQKEEVAAALKALCTLAAEQTSVLRSYGSYLAGVLDHLEVFDDCQLEALFDMFGTLTAERGEGNDGGASTSGAGSSSRAGGSAYGGSRGGASLRLQDEVHIVVNKALSQLAPAYKRIGIVGSVTDLRQMAATFVARGGDPGVEMEWARRVDSIMRQCECSAAATAFLLSRMTSLARPVTLGPGRTTAGAAVGGTPAALPPPLARALTDRLHGLIENTFLIDLPYDDHKRPLPLPPAGGGAPGGAEPWFNLDGSDACVAIRFAHLLASQSPAERGAPLWLGPCFRLFAELGDVSDFDAMLGCPLAGFGCEALDRFADLPARTREGMVSVVFYASAWLREVVGVFCSRLDALGDGNAEEAAEVSSKVLARLAQLRLLGLLLDHLVSEHAAPLALPDLNRPLADGSAGAAAVTAARSAAAAAQPGSASAAAAALAAERAAAAKPAGVAARLRPLPLAALRALAVDGPAAAPLASLTPACYVLADLHSRLTVLLKKQVPSFLGAAAAPTTAPSEAAPEVLATLRPLLPAVCGHLDASLRALRDQPDQAAAAGGWMPGLPGDDCAFTAALLPLRTVAPVAALHATARRVAHAALDSFALLLAAAKPHDATLAPALLAALAAQAAANKPADGDGAAQRPLPAAVDAWTAAHWLQAAKVAFGYVSGAMAPPSCAEDLALDLSLLRMLAAIVAVAEERVGAEEPRPPQAAAPLRRLHTQLSAAVRSLLEAPLNAPLDAPGSAEARAALWKGQGGAIAELLAALVSHDAAPLALLQELCAESLPEVPAKAAAKKAAEPCGGFGALSPSTFACWYRALFEQLNGQLDKLTAAAVASEKSSSSAGAAPLSSDATTALVEDCYKAAKAFVSLVQLTKVHQSKVAVQGQAVKHGGRFVASFAKTLPFWRRHHDSAGRHFVSIVSELQRGTKLLQVLCAEGKSRKALPVTAKVPQVKRTLERFVLQIKAFFHDMQHSGANPGVKVWIGQLKHRDLSGNALPSQLCPPDKEDEGTQEGDAADDSGNEEGAEEAGDVDYDEIAGDGGDDESEY